MSSRQQAETCRRALQRWGWEDVHVSGHYIQAICYSPSDGTVGPVQWCVPALYKHVKHEAYSATVGCDEHPLGASA